MNTVWRRWAVLVLVAVAVGLAANRLVRRLAFAPGPPVGVVEGRAAGALGAALTTVAGGLEVPWELVFLPGGDLLLTERPGRLVRLAPDGAVRWRAPVPGVVARGEGGLLGLALDPDYEATRRIFLYLTTADDNRVVRYRLGDDGTLADAVVVIDGIPAARFHDGGRIAFGPDGRLYVTTGDAGDPARSPDPASLAGKVLRLEPDGRVPEDNPSGTPVWSLGHRNPQGLAWDDAGRLWLTEHGRSGSGSGFDEVNLVEAGADYGWPRAQGDEAPTGVRPPVVHSGPDATWAPSGAAWLDGTLWFGGLRGQALYAYRPDGRAAPGGRDDGGRPTAHLRGDVGRIRQVRVGPDGALYLLTNNRDGRGRARRGDDRVLRVDPRALAEGGLR